MQSPAEWYLLYPAFILTGQIRIHTDTLPIAPVDIVNFIPQPVSYTHLDVYKRQFQSQAKSAGTAVRFVILAAIQLVASWLLVWGIGSLLGGGDEVNTILKVVVDLVIFMASFTIQRDWVFKESKGLLK